MPRETSGTVFSKAFEIGLELEKQVVDLNS
jgi:hypothetical protein